MTKNSEMPSKVQCLRVKAFNLQLDLLAPPTNSSRWTIRSFTSSWGSRGSSPTRRSTLISIPTLSLHHSTTTTSMTRSSTDLRPSSKLSTRSLWMRPLLFLTRPTRMRVWVCDLRLGAPQRESRTTGIRAWPWTTSSSQSDIRHPSTMKVAWVTLRDGCRRVLWRRHGTGSSCWSSRGRRRRSRSRGSTCSGRRTGRRASGRDDTSR